MELMPMMKEQLKSMVPQYKSRVLIMSLQKVQTEIPGVKIDVHQNALAGNGKGIALNPNTSLICGIIALKLALNVVVPVELLVENQLAADLLPVLQHL